MTDVNLGKTVIKLPQGSEIDYFECDREQLMHIAVKFEAMISALLKLCQDNEAQLKELRSYTYAKLEPQNAVAQEQQQVAEIASEPQSEGVTVVEGETAPAYPY